MAKVLIKKFTLRRNGVEFKAGTIVELPEAEAKALVENAPQEFELISEKAVVVVEPEEPAKPNAPEGAPADTGEKPLTDYLNSELEAMCAELGIDVPNKANKQKLIELIESAAETGEDDESNLPEVDAAATVK